MATWVEGAVVGGAGGALAGIILWFLAYAREKVLNLVHMNRVHKWFRQYTVDEKGKRFRSTRTIASYNNLTQDRVRFVCSLDKRVVLSTGQKEDVWGLADFVKRVDPTLES